MNINGAPFQAALSILFIAVLIAQLMMKANHSEPAVQRWQWLELLLLPLGLIFTIIVLTRFRALIG